MAALGRPILRDLFDEGTTPFIGHPPETHHLDYYLATDGSYRVHGGGLGSIIETRDGMEVDRTSQFDHSPDNNIAEYRALHLGLDILAARIPPDATVGIVLDHKELASNVNAERLLAADPSDDMPVSVSIPPAAKHHWRGIRARLATLSDVRAARVESRRNPAHPLANEPEAYKHLRRSPDRCVLPNTVTDLPDEGIPPPSRAPRQRSD